MGILLGLLAALSYGGSDFAAGLSGRRVGAGPVTLVVQMFGLIAAGIAVIFFPGEGLTATALGWGAVSGVGGAAGSLALFRGLAVGQMGVVAPLSAVVTAVLPVIVGVIQGEHLSVLARVGIGIAVPAIGLVSLGHGSTDAAGQRAGIIAGVLSGIGFALLFVALDRAGKNSGAWPLVPGQAVGVLLVLPVAWRNIPLLWARTSTIRLVVAAGILGGIANLFFLASTRHGQLAVVAVLTSLFPAVTIVLARIVLGERWSALQKIGLVAAAVASVLVGAG